MKYLNWILSKLFKHDNMIGKKVYHRLYGNGEVINTRYFGYECRVLFERGRIEKWVKIDELIILDETKEEIYNIDNQEEKLDKNSVKSFSGYKYVPTSKDNFKERTIIEALKLGIVPHKYIDEFVFGREEEIKSIKEWLEDEEDKKILVINGEYGSGKTHLASYIESLGLKLGYATSFVELDYYEAPFYRPKRVYRSIVSSFRYLKNNRIYRFRDFIREIRKLGYWDGHYFFKYINPAYEDENIWDWIEAREVGSGSERPYEIIYKNGKEFNKYQYLLPLYDHYTSINVYFNLMSSIAHGLKNILKKKGFLIVFDEAESINFGSREQLEKNRKFIYALSLLVKNDVRLKYKKICEEELGLEFTKISKKVSGVPYMYGDNFNLKVVFTFTKQDFPIDNSFYINIEKLRKKHLREIFEAVYEYYSKAYSLEVESNIREKMFNILVNENKPLRLFVKGVVEVFDLWRLNRDLLLRKYGIK